MIPREWHHQSGSTTNGTSINLPGSMSAAQTKFPSDIVYSVPAAPTRYQRSGSANFQHLFGTGSCFTSDKGVTLRTHVK